MIGIFYILPISNVITSAEKGQTPCYKGLKAIFSSPLVPSLVPRDEASVCSSCWVAIDKIPRSPACRLACHVWFFLGRRNLVPRLHGRKIDKWIDMCSIGGIEGMKRIRSACVKTSSSKTCFVSLSRDLVEAIGLRVQVCLLAVFLVYIVCCPWSATKN